MQRIVQVREQFKGIDAELMARRDEAHIVKADLANKRVLVAEGIQSAASIVEMEREYHQMTGSIGALTAQAAELREREVELEMAHAAIGMMPSMMLSAPPKSCRTALLKRSRNAPRF